MCKQKFWSLTRYLFMIKYSGPLTTPAAKARVESLIASAEKEGGRILLDGRNVRVDGFPLGNFVGPTVIEGVTSMTCYKYAHYFLRLYVILTILQGRNFRPRPCRALGGYSR